VNALDDPALRRLWEAVALRLQRNGLSPTGSIVLDRLSREERFAIAGLLGRRVGQRVRVDLAAVDTRVRSTGAAPGLVAAVTTRCGPLEDRAGLRAAAQAERNAVWAAAREALESHGLAGQPWAEAWLDGIRAVVGRVDPHRRIAVVTTSVRCIARLPWDRPARGRTELASSVAGGSHALDDGSVLGALVVRAIALRLDVPPPLSPGDRRDLWARAGVLSDEVSTTALTLGLRPAGDAAIAKAVRTRAETGCEAHLTLRDLRRLDRLVEAGAVVSVCENPRVLEAAMDAGSSGVVVCTSGNPTLVATTLLGRLVADGAALRYHGDFDWAGIAIANRVITAYGASPWRMSAGDYRDALADAPRGVELVPLEGFPVVAAWDGDLTPAMARAGAAVHEELMLDLLVSDLLAADAGRGSQHSR
jgi:uncharacterized protein (TIGR02679 family)